jgi:uncharacterized membrane protein
VLLIVLDVLTILLTNFLLYTGTYTHGFLFILTKWLTFGKIIVTLEKRLRLLWLSCISFDDVQNAICILKLGINDGNFSTFVCLFLECLEWVVCSCWFLLVLFASLFVHTHAPQQVYLCLVLLTVRLISCISDMLGLIGLVMGYCVTLCNVLWIMHCVSLAILSQWSRFHPPTVGTNWPIQCWHAVKHQTNKCY